MSLFVLYYHRISIEGDVDISLSNFERQMRFLKENAHVCDLDELCSFIETKRIPSRPTVAITFDDGFYDTYAFAQPILEKYGLVATVFAITSKIEKGTPRITLKDYWEGKCTLYDFPKPSPYSLNIRDTAYPYKEAFMNTEELLICDRKNLRVELHGHLHQKLFTWPPEVVGKFSLWQSQKRIWWLRHIYKKPRKGMAILRMESSLSARKINISQPDALIIGRNLEAIELGKTILIESQEDQAKRIKEEVITGKKILESILHRKISYICWPWGEYSDVSISVAKDLGFKASFTTKKALIDSNTDLFRIPRISARRNFYKFLKRFFFCSNPLLFKSATILGISF